MGLEDPVCLQGNSHITHYRRTPMNLQIKELLSGLPEIVQYLAVLGLVMLILYICLTITRLFGQGRGEQVKYDNPEEYEKNVPDLFASTFLKRKVKKDKKASGEEQD